MPHPELDNRTPFATELLLLADEDGRPLLVPLLQAVFAIGDDGDLLPLQPQPAIAIGGQWWGDPASSSLRYEPQIAPAKLSTDVVVLGHAVAPGGRATEMRAGVRVGALQHIVHVSGDRRLLGGSRITAAEPFDRIPLRYEHAFGGWDRRAEDPAAHRYEARNPVGRGFRDATLPVDGDVLLPNLEDPVVRFRGYGDRPPPRGLGFVSPDWEPRAGFAGTYDEAWMQHRRPLLPEDFDRRFYNAASVGMVTPRPLGGDEPVTLAGMSPSGRLDFVLPGLPSPTCTLALRGERRVEPTMTLDTVVIDADARTVAMTWRSCHVARNGPQDLLSMQVRVPGLSFHGTRLAR